MASYKKVEEEPYVTTTLPMEEETSKVSKFSHLKVVVASLLVGLLIITGVALTIYLVQYEESSEPSKILEVSSLVLLAGGKGSERSVEVFGPNCNIRLQDLEVGREDHSAHYFNQQVLLCGGSSYAKSTCSVLDEKTKIFQHHSNLAKNKDAHVGMVLENKLFLIGGYSSGFQNSMESLKRPATTWKDETSDMKVARNRACAVATSKTTLLVIGGHPQTSVVEEYSTITQKWRKLAPMLGDGRSGLSCAALESAHVLVAGGYDGTYLKTAQLYNIEKNKWSMAGSLNKGRYMAEMVISNGRILIMGGKASGDRNLESVEEYHPKNNSWTLLQTHLKRPRSYFAATVVPRSIFNC